MIIEQGKWNKSHLVESIKYLSHHPSPHRDYMEFGTYRGESMQLIETLFYAYQIGVRKGFGFDSFEGLPAETPGVPRFYLFEPGMFADVNFLWATRATTFVKGWFADLTPNHVTQFDIKPACFVHIDGDLYISAIQALTFLLENRLIDKGTVIAFDEFKSTPNLTDGGESRAHIEIAQRWNITFREIYRNVYFDRLECWQNAFVVEGFDRADPGIYGWENK